MRQVVQGIQKQLFSWFNPFCIETLYRYIDFCKQMLAAVKVFFFHFSPFVLSRSANNSFANHAAHSFFQLSERGPISPSCFIFMNFLPLAHKSPHPSPGILFVVSEQAGSSFASREKGEETRCNLGARSSLVVAARRRLRKCQLPSAGNWPSPPPLKKRKQ